MRLAVLTGNVQLDILCRMNCPRCGRLLYSLRRATCGYCGGLLPDEIRLGEEEIAAQEAELKAIGQHRAVAKAKEEKEREEARKRDGWTIGL